MRHRMLPRQLIIVSNRLPVQLSFNSDHWHIQSSSGGLVSALSGVSSHLHFDWVGWPGADIGIAEQDSVKERLQTKHHYYPVFLSTLEIERFYNGFCNRVLWPLFHYLPSHVDFSLPYWGEYQAVNAKFAEALLPLCRQDTIVWIHDYQLFLLPELLRRERPNLKIGFFLHIPFPSSEIYRLLPVRKEILSGILGSDLIGFQTHDHLRHFSSTCLRVLGHESTPSEVHLGDRRVQLGAYPIGINPDLFITQLQDPQTQEHLKTLDATYDGQKIILGVDRLDYTKGLSLKFQAYEQFLENNPHMRETTQLIQIAVPSRGAVQEYQDLKTDIDTWVGRINGRFGSMSHTPITYLAQSVTFAELCALYRRANVLLVTSIRDGMNLVSHEYIACQNDQAGVLILSEFAGTATLLSHAVSINPWSTQAVAHAISDAFTMPEKERRNREAHNLDQIMTFTSLNWARRFIQELQKITSGYVRIAQPLHAHARALHQAYTTASKRLLLLDYDGTLVPHVPDPATATPSIELLELLKSLCEDRHNRVYVVSGRAQFQMEAWLNSVPNLGLAAEHGLFFKECGQHQWVSLADARDEWMSNVIPILEDYVRQTPGAFIERKRASLVWHYRQVPEIFGNWQAHELTLHLDQSLANLPVEVISGNKIVEVRRQGIHKGLLIQKVLATHGNHPFVLCLGDDRTDEDMFAALPESAWSCRIGPPQTQARFYLNTLTEALDLLETLANTEPLAERALVGRNGIPQKHRNGHGSDTARDWRDI